MIEGISVKDFVKKTLDGIKDGTSKEFLVSSVNFEMITTSEKIKDGKFDVKVISAGMDVKDKVTHRVTASIISKESSREGIKMVRELFESLVKCGEKMEKSKERKFIKVGKRTRKKKI